VAGETPEAIVQPEWPVTLSFSVRPTGCGISMFCGCKIEALAPVEAEIGVPLVFRQRYYDFLPMDDRRFECSGGSDQPS